MISFSEAKQLILKHCKSAKIESRLLPDALGYILAEDMFAEIDTPPFDNSAMDGYAFSFEQWDKSSPLKVVGEVLAGNNSTINIAANETIRIYTGAPIPANTDTVVVQEKVQLKENLIFILDSKISKAQNVRPRGSQTKRNSVALQKGQMLSPVAISYMAGMGVTKAIVYSKPRVSIIVTGKELVQAGKSISKGKIYESNGVGLTAALRFLSIEPVFLEIVDDEREDIEMAIRKGLQSDILIITGGVSVGDYDLVPHSLEKCGVEKIFHKVRQKPGKPFYFGTTSNTLVFALPGNPAAVLSCFYAYVLLAINAFTKRTYLKSCKLPLAHDFEKKEGFTLFLKAKTWEQNVKMLDSQLSYLLNSFAVADCLVILEEERTTYKKGDEVEVIMII